MQKNSNCPGLEGSKLKVTGCFPVTNIIVFTRVLRHTQDTTEVHILSRYLTKYLFSETYLYAT